MQFGHGPRVDTSPFVEFELKVVPGQGGFHAFLVGTRPNGDTEDLIPISEIPAMKTYQDAEELGLVILWQKLVDCTDTKGNPYTPTT